MLTDWPSVEYTIVINTEKRHNDWGQRSIADFHGFMTNNPLHHCHLLEWSIIFNTNTYTKVYFYLTLENVDTCTTYEMKTTI